MSYALLSRPKPKAHSAASYRPIEMTEVTPSAPLLSPIDDSDDPALNALLDSLPLPAALTTAAPALTPLPPPIPTATASAVAAPSASAAVAPAKVDDSLAGATPRVVVVPEFVESAASVAARAAAALQQLQREAARDAERAAKEAEQKRVEAIARAAEAERTAAAERRATKLAALKRASDVSATSALVHINAGGVRHVTSLATIDASKSFEPDSLISALCQQHATAHAANTSVSGDQKSASAGTSASAAPELFIDRDGTTFGYLLEWLRAGGQTVPLIPSAFMRAAVLREAEFFELTGLVRAMTCGDIDSEVVTAFKTHTAADHKLTPSATAPALTAGLPTDESLRAARERARAIQRSERERKKNALLPSVEPTAKLIQRAFGELERNPAVWSAGGGGSGGSSNEVVVWVFGSESLYREHGIHRVSKPAAVVIDADAYRALTDDTRRTVLKWYLTSVCHLTVRFYETDYHAVTVTWMGDA